jgi:hypothetical protein
VTHREPPRWLADLQRAFSSALRAPLDRSTLTLRAREESYGAEILGEVLPRGDTTPAARLAVYNRQYWFRLFTVLQGEFPLTARVAGFWSFNALAERHLLERPPSSFDIGQAADGFEAMIRRLDDGDLPPALRDRHLALHDAANIDEAFRAVASSPDEPAFRPGPDDTAALLEHGLAASSRWRLVEERFALLELRQRLCGAPVNDERPRAGVRAYPAQPGACRAAHALAVAPPGPGAAGTRAQVPGREESRAPRESAALARPERRARVLDRAGRRAWRPPCSTAEPMTGATGAPCSSLVRDGRFV